jgi:bile acid:Na+ symporter, BASS family
MFESLKALDTIRLNFSPEGLLAINFTLAFIMFGVALDIKVEHFKRILLNPKTPIIGVISQFFMLPLVTFLLVILFNQIITPSVAMGMILVASCPGGNISNFMSAMAKANTALSVSLTAFSTLAAIFLTPFNFAFWGGLYTNFIGRIDSGTLLQPLQIDPVQMFQTVFILLGIPLIIGMLFNWKFPVRTAKIMKPIRKISVLLFMIIVLLAFLKNYDHFLAHIKFIFFIVLIHNALALTTGFTFATIFKRKAADRRTITIETGIQNSGLALVLLFNPKIFPPELAIGGMAFIAAWWGIWHILSGLSIAYLWSKIPMKN